MDDDQRIVRWNHGASRLLGYAAGEVLHRHCYDLIAGSGRDGRRVCRRDCEVHRCIAAGGLPASRELQVRTKDGRRIWLHLSLIVIPGERAPLTAHLILDISGHRQIAETMARVASLCQADGGLLTDVDRRSSVAGPAVELRQPYTPREREVLRLLADGMSTEGIANRLCVSTHTVRNHVQHIMEKCGAHSRTELVSCAFRGGLL